MHCPAGFTINKNKELCECPVAKPYLSAGNVCIACENAFDETTLKCIVCANGTVWSQQDKTCSCPEDSYLAYNDTCISCGTLFDEEKQDCIECSNGEVWNLTTKKCVCPA
uniref:Predicted protein n=1 Tax=Hordeum vulgare subsp. vulgare TaxID=112509 RepID=F2DT96_HORVV|nr:predicted protein [Hordeum vulgare subsp. vulgare]